MNGLEELRLLFEQYLNEVDELMRKRKPADGILGMGNGPQDNPCHERFDGDVARLIEKLLNSGIEKDAAAEIVGFLLRDEALSHGVNCAQLMLVAVQRHALPLIPLLTARSAADLMADYSRTYPIFKRFPTQKEILRALRKQTER